MKSEEFREFGKAAVDFIADYIENIREIDVLPSVSPGYLAPLLPNTIPETPEDWRAVMSDISRIILPGITHWQSPNFHAYYPTASSYPSIVGEMLSAGFGIVGFSWVSVCITYLPYQSFFLVVLSPLFMVNEQKNQLTTFLLFVFRRFAVRRVLNWRLW